MKSLRTESQSKYGGIEFIDYYFNDVHIATARKYSDYFCTVDRHGRPSNIRNRTKKCRSFTWDRNGLIKVLGHSDFTIGSRYSRSFNSVSPDFMDDYPDTTWGYAGKIPSKKTVFEIIQSKIKP